MLVRHLDDLQKITAIDDTILCEIINPLHDDGNLKLGYSIAHAIIKPGNASLSHRIKTSSEIYYILSGSGLMYVDEESEDVGPGDTIYVPPNATQYIENTGGTDLVFLCIVYPSWRAEDEELV
ncbi:MAG: cupin domain-containing protein [Candidatus Thorarchaeota archaeon]|jgi:mannose-6-phosphate isomerase-like protein (cupin superfamily)|nr:cupin domain-containing protein [Candidatus Thorarchaeota archaeon]